MIRHPKTDRDLLAWALLATLVSALAVIPSPAVAVPATQPAAPAQPTAAGADVVPPAAAARVPGGAPGVIPGLTVAVLSFQADDPTQKDLGPIIGQTITAMLSGQPDLRLVERADLDKALKEHELNLTGLVSSEQAIRVGRLVGAQILITGKAFRLGEQLFITAKLIGSETSLVDGVLVHGKADTGMDALVLELAKKIAGDIATKGPRLIASHEPADPLLALKKALAGKRLPTVAVVIAEHQIARGRPNHWDPAAETEVKRVLRACGITIKDVAANALTDWAKAGGWHRHRPWPRSLAHVDLVIAGEGFSEFAAQIGQLETCTARVEIDAIDRHTGHILLADRANTRAVDLSENLAGREALQKAGHLLALRVLKYLAKTLPARPAH